MVVQRLQLLFRYCWLKVHHANLVHSHLIRAGGNVYITVVLSICAAANAATVTVVNFFHNLGFLIINNDVKTTI
jgi:hypothetical protein